MLNVVFSSDNGYSHFLLIALTSLLDNNIEDFSCINIYILDDGIYDNNKKRIYELTQKYHCNVTFIEANIFEFIDLDILPMEIGSNLKSFTTYNRLFMASFLPKDVDKVLYLDCDALILGSYKDLWNEDIEDYYCAGVIEPIVNETLKKSFWFFDVDYYINAGFLLINLEKWRNDNVEKKFIEFLSNNQNRYFCADQGVINFVFEGKIKIVEPKYNLLSHFQYLDYDVAKKFIAIENEYYSKQIVEDSRNNPVFVHFTGKGYSSPWSNKDHKFSLIYEKYAKMAQCEDVISYIEAPTFKAKLLHKYSDNKLFVSLLKVIPSKLIGRIVNKNLISIFKNEELKGDIID